MSREPVEEAPPPVSGLRQYQIIGAAGLVVMALPLFARGLGVWCCFPLLVGVLAAALNWRAGPYLVLLSLLFLAFCDYMEVTPVDIVAGCFLFCADPFQSARGSMDRSALGWRMDKPVPLLDLVLAVGLLVYMIAAFRLLGLQKNIFPIDPRRRLRISTRRQETRVRRLPPPKPQQRSEALVQSRESVLILILALACAVTGWLLGLWLRARNTFDDLSFLHHDGLYIDISDETWRLLLLTWLVSMLLIVVSGMLAYVGMLKRTPEEAQLYLQDQLWKETRREQGRISRWMAWAALDARRQLPLDPPPPPNPDKQGRQSR